MRRAREQKREASRESTTEGLVVRVDWLSKLISLRRVRRMSGRDRPSQRARGDGAMGRNGAPLAGAAAAQDVAAPHRTGWRP
jgi:hypothetical protein